MVVCRHQYLNKLRGAQAVMTFVRFCQASVPQMTLAKTKAPKENMEKMHSQAQEEWKAIQPPCLMGQAVSFWQNRFQSFCQGV